MTQVCRPPPLSPVLGAPAHAKRSDWQMMLLMPEREFFQAACGVLCVQ